MTQMPVAVNQIDRLTPREWPLLVGRGCASGAARFEMIAEGWSRRHGCGRATRCWT